MKIISKKAWYSIFTICVIAMVWSFVGIANVWAISTASATSGTQKDLTEFRKIYISEEDEGYNSVQPTSLPYGNEKAMTSLFVGSSEENAYQFVVNYNEPTIYITNASDFFVNVSFKDLYVDETIDNEETTSPNTLTHYVAEDRHVVGELSEEYYKLNSDDWGEHQTGNNPESVTSNGLQVVTGKIETGAIVVQTSYDKTNWTVADGGKYANGLYTTNVLNNYHGTTQQYVLDGDDVRRGIYVTVNFFYEVKHYTDVCDKFLFLENHKKKTEYLNICESYTFFVVAANPDVVSFNNLTLSDKEEIVQVAKPDSQNSEEFEKQTEQYNEYLSSVVNKMMDTMKDNSMTTTGFRINVTANPYLGILLQKNGEHIDLPEKQEADGQIFYEITDTGKYTITISAPKENPVRIIQKTLYIDRASADEAYVRYFGNKKIYNGQTYGDEFIDYSPDNGYGNKRIFDAYMDVPVFIAPLKIKLQEVSQEYCLPLYGRVINKSTGAENWYNGTPVYNNGEQTYQMTLFDWGEYEAIFYTHPDYYKYINGANVELSGDVRVYRFKFKLVGKDVDKTINQELMSTNEFKGFSIASPSDYVPKYYYVARNTAGKGRVRVAFADKVSALDYATKVAWSELEYLGDGEWRFHGTSTGEPVFTASGWQNAALVNEYAQSSVHEGFFDLSATYSILTLSKSAQEIEEEGTKFEDLQCEALDKTVIVWYNAEHRNKALVKNLVINDQQVAKIISYQKKAVLVQGEDGRYSVIEEEQQDYMFIKDVLGLDSFLLRATDSKGNSFSLNYGEGLYEQFVKLGCEPGLVAIEETNVYGTIMAQYNVCFIRQGNQPAKVAVIVDQQSQQLSQENTLQNKVCTSFAIKQVSDYIDPCTFVRIKYTDKNNNVTFSYYMASETEEMTFDAAGKYEVAVIDRYGNNFKNTLEIN